MAGNVDSVSIRVPYKNLKQSEVELVGLDNVDESRHHHHNRLSLVLAFGAIKALPNMEEDGRLVLPELYYDLSCCVTIIGFSADIGYLLGDTKEHCSTSKGTRSSAVFVFIIEFWLLDLANNTVQMIVSLGAGPWDALFGGGNIPAFVLASLFSLAAGIVATLKLPTLSSRSYESSGFHFG